MRETIDKMISNENTMDGYYSRKRSAPAQFKVKTMETQIGLTEDSSILHDLIRGHWVNA